IPTDLETVVLVALAREPGRRYRSAQDLADDLQRFLDHKPVLARRPGLWQRLQKAVRRHRAIVLTTALAFVCALVATIGVLLVKNAEVRAEQEQTGEARDRAEEHFEESEANFRRARQVVDRMLRRVAEELREQPNLEALR